MVFSDIIVLAAVRKMSVLEASTYTVVELREFLKKRNLNATGTKPDLIARLDNLSPNIWTELQEETEQLNEEEARKRKLQLQRQR